VRGAEQPGRGADRGWPTERAAAWANAAELLLLAGLVAAGAWLAAALDAAGIVTGLALAGTALLLARLRIRLRSAAEDSAAAARDARIARAVAAQLAAPPDSVELSSELREADGPDPWAHPALRRGAPVPYDPQKNQWGGKEERNGRRLSAEVEPLDAGWFRVLLVLASTDPARPVAGRVRFHLDDSFPQNRVIVRPQGGIARLERIARTRFTAGAEVENEPGTFLELDLAGLGGEASPDQSRLRPSG
jgi:hypothetical protein